MGVKEALRFQGFNRKNSYTLFLLTLAYIVGEICHFLIGSLTMQMARDIDYGDYACYLKPQVTNKTTIKCNDKKLYPDNET